MSKARNNYKTFAIWMAIPIVLLCLGTHAQLLPNFGGERAGLSALGFLKNDMNPRSMAMGGASIALPANAFSLHTNPAAAADIESFSISTSNMLVGAGVNQSFLSAIFTGKREDVIGASINVLNSGAIEERTEFQPLGTGRKVYATNLSAGVSYAKKLSAVFNFGVTVKYIYEQLADFTNHTAAVDLSFLYKTDYKDLNFAVVLKNFGGNSSLTGDFLAVNFNRTKGTDLEDNTIPTVFSLGMSMVPYKKGKHSLLASLQLNHPNDNAENIRLGAEYSYLNLLFVQAGYKLNVEGQYVPSFGLGMRTRIGAHPFHIHYAANPTNYFGMQHNFGLSFQLNKMTR